MRSEKAKKNLIEILDFDRNFVGRDWSPVSSNKARVVTAVELRVDHRAPLQPSTRSEHSIRISSEPMSDEKQGYLVKRGGFRKNWKRRFIVVGPAALDGCHVLRYFENEGDFSSLKAKKAKYLGRFELVSDTKMLLSGADFPEIPNTPWIFMVKFPSRELYLSAASEEERNEWVEFLRAAIAGAREEKKEVDNPLADISPAAVIEGQVQPNVENPTNEEVGGKAEAVPKEEEADESCILGGDLAADTVIVRSEELRRKSTAAPYMVEKSQQQGEAVSNLNKLSRYGHALIFSIAFIPSLFYAIVFSDMLYGAEIYVQVTAEAQFAHYFYGAAAAISLMLYVLDVGLWEGQWAKAKHVCMFLCGVAVVAGAVAGGEDNPSYPMAIFLFSNVGFFIACKRHPIISEVKNEVRLVDTNTPPPPEYDNSTTGIPPLALWFPPLEQCALAVALADMDVKWQLMGKETHAIVGGDQLRGERFLPSSVPDVDSAVAR
jgi:hypothetical protein